jgi:hypothetical protein
MSPGALLLLLAQVRAGDFVPFALAPLYVPQDLPLPGRGGVRR